jgi:hypothetical protein
VILLFPDGFLGYALRARQPKTELRP